MKRRRRRRVLTDNGELGGGGEARVGDVRVAGGTGKSGLVVPGLRHHRQVRPRFLSDVTGLREEAGHERGLYGVTCRFF